MKQLDEIRKFLKKKSSNKAKKSCLKICIELIWRKMFSFFECKALGEFKELMKWLAFSLGNLLEISSITSDLKLDYKTVDNYLNILINTYVVRLISPFHKNLVTKLKKSKKIYFVDTGLRNAVLNNFSLIDVRRDKGNLFENFILNELLFEGFEVKCWRTTAKAEVDFVLNLGKDVVPIEVKSLGKIRRSF